jgi:phage terminase large subunit-like protein
MEENEFKRARLNMQTEEASHVIDISTWDAASDVSHTDYAAQVEWRKQAMIDLRGKRCFGGLDLGESDDLSSLVLHFPIDNGRFIWLAWAWSPAATIRRREMEGKFPYLAWKRGGFMTETPGNVTDYSSLDPISGMGVIERDIVEISKQFDIQSIGMDPHYGTELAQHLLNAKVPIMSFRQGYISMGEPTARFLELVAERQIDHGANPVLRWTAGNLVVTRDLKGNKCPAKGKAMEKIDPMVAGIMAVGRWIEHRKEPERGYFFAVG